MVNTLPELLDFHLTLIIMTDIVLMISKQSKAFLMKMATIGTLSFLLQTQARSLIPFSLWNKSSITTSFAKSIMESISVAPSLSFTPPQNPRDPTNPAPTPVPPPVPASMSNLKRFAFSLMVWNPYTCHYNGTAPLVDTDRLDLFHVENTN